MVYNQIKILTLSFIVLRSTKMKLNSNLKNVEEVLNLYEKIFSNIPIGIVAYDESGQCYFTTKKTAKMIGAKCIDDILVQNFHEINSWKENGLYSVVLKALSDNITYQYISNVKTSFGKNTWFEFIATSFFNENKKNLIVILVDITEIKENELSYKEKSIYDSLTGIHNRRYFDERYEIEIQHCCRAELPFSLILIDIDFFKLYNDTYGHVAGDECLKSIAQAIKNSLTRKSDSVSRYGGEEFICTLPYTNEKGALKVANNIKEAINKLKIPHSSSKVYKYVTVSQGVYTKTSIIKKSEIENFIQYTDIALYSAKEHGRNKIKIFKDITK